MAPHSLMPGLRLRGFGNLFAREEKCDLHHIFAELTIGNPACQAVLMLCRACIFGNKTRHCTHAHAPASGSIGRSNPILRIRQCGHDHFLPPWREGCRIFCKGIRPVFDAEDFLRLPNRTIYLKLMIDGMPSQPFSATILTPGGAA